MFLFIYFLFGIGLLYSLTFLQLKILCKWLDAGECLLSSKKVANT